MADKLTSQQARAILAEISEDPILICLRLVSEAALSVGKVLALKAGDVVYSGGRFHVHLGGGELRAISDDLACELLALAIEDWPEQPLVRYHQSTVWRRLDKAAKSVGLEGVNTRSLRGVLGADL